MAVSLLLITHENIGDAIIQSAKNTLGEFPLEVSSISIDYKTDPESLLPDLIEMVKQLNKGDGVLILTDMFGSTPSNIAQNLQQTSQCYVVAGLNLPMLIRVMNYAHLELSELGEKACSGGLNGIVDCHHHDHKKNKDN